MNQSEREASAGKSHIWFWFYFWLDEIVARAFLTNQRAKESKTNGNTTLLSTLTWKLLYKRFPNECRKTITQVIILTNHNKNKTQNEPIVARNKYK